MGSSNNDLGDFGIGLEDLGDLEQNDDLNLNDIFDLGGGMDQPGSPSSPKRGMSQPNSPRASGAGGAAGGTDFRYGQEEAGDRHEILQQPLALGYLVSTAATGPMPKWFWSSCPHLENVCPVFLRSALHINTPLIPHGGDDGFTPSSASGRVHSLDSSFTTDVLRYVNK